MCVIAYKPTNIAFPEEQYLKNCFENNSHGAGFMYTWENEVHIKKGYKTYEAFKSALDKARKITGDNVPYVMHFRIATQGYDVCMTHPFPLSGNMDKLKYLRCKCNIGVAHNGILDITSDGSKQYSDTMKFITDFLSLIIRGYDYYKDKRTVQLIENLIEGSRLAILDKNGTCSLFGEGWIQDKGVWYSNTSYSYKKYVYNSFAWEDDYWDKGIYSSNYGVTAPKMYSKDYWDWWKTIGNKYDFWDTFCPVSECDDDSYCENCNRMGKCNYTSGIIENEMKRKARQLIG